MSDSPAGVGAAFGPEGVEADRRGGVGACPATGVGADEVGFDGGTIDERRDDEPSEGE